MGDNFASTHSHNTTSDNFYFQTQPSKVISHNSTAPVSDYKLTKSHLYLRNM